MIDPVDPKDGLTITERGPQIALLTPYDGGNLGDAAIQDAIIAKMRLRLPNAKLWGVCLNCDNFEERHGEGAFPLCGTNRPFYGMSHGSLGVPTGQEQNLIPEASRKRLNVAWVKSELKKIPGLWRYLKTGRAWATGPWREMFHWIKAYRFLRTQDLLIVSGGGQLDEEWGGAWGHPYALFKWAVLARIARVPYAMASVGAQKAVSTTSRFFMSTALRLASYRSYRDRNSKKIASGLLRCAEDDPIAPDLAFSLTPLKLPTSPGFQATDQSRPTIAISPIAFAKPGRWPRQDLSLYQRYLQQMGRVVSELLMRGYFLTMAYSSLGDDESVIPELLELLDDEAKRRVAWQMCIPKISTWKDFAACLHDADFLIASRLHSAILGFVTQTPTIAISFDPKVDWVMEDLGQTEYLLQIRDFTAAQVISTLERIECQSSSVLERIGAYGHVISPVLESQYDALAAIATAHSRPIN